MAPFGSRARVLRQLQREIVDGRGSVVAGEAGIGKTRLVRVAAERLEAQGFTIDRVLATEAASTVPFGAMTGLLEPGARVPVEPLEILRGTAERLGRRARASRGALLVDDAHLLDPASAALVLTLSTRHGVKLLVTLRSGARAPDAVRALWKDAGLPRLELAPLDESDTGTLVRELLGGPLDAQTRRWLWQVSGGNPLYASELARAGVERGWLATRDGRWQRVGPFVSVARLEELLDARLDELAAGPRRALALIALSEPTPVELLGRLGALDDTGELEARRLVAAAPGGCLRVVHPLYGELVRQGLSALEARRLRAELVALLEPDVLREATWALQSGEHSDAAQLAAGAREALAAFDPDLAVELGTAAMRTAPSLDSALPLAEGLRIRRRHADAESQLEAVEGQAAESGQLTRYLFVRATNLHWGLGREAEAQALLDRFAPHPGAAAVRGALLSSTGRLEAAVRCSTGAFEAAQDDAHARSIAAIALGNDLALLGRPGLALETLDRAEAACGTVESEWPRAALAVQAAWLEGRDCAGPRRALELRLERAAAAGDDLRAALCELVLARFALPRGELDAALAWAEDALDRLALLDPRGLAPACEATLAEALALSGRDEAALNALSRAIAGQERAPGDGPAALVVLLARIAVLGLTGDGAAARELALTAAGQAGEAVLVEAELLHLHLRLGGDGAAVCERLTAIAGASQSGLADLWARHADCRARCDGDGLEAVAHAYERLELRVYAAEAAAHAAAAHTSAGAARRPEALAMRLRAATGVRGAPASEHASLTRREREVAALAARGLSNAAIATQLSLSVRTVESHVYRATTKLGVRDRRALRSAIGTH